MPFSWPAEFDATQQDLDALCVIASLRSLTPGAVVAQARDGRSAAAILDLLRRGRGCSPADREIARTTDPAAVRAAALQVGARIVTPRSSEFPPSLCQLEDPPSSLFVRGRPLDEVLPGVAVIGARSCSPAGADAALAVGRGLARAGITVVSGAARGIDAAAQRAAIEAGGASVAFLGSGIDTLYPRSSAQMLLESLTAGAVVSEYPPGTPAEPYRFPARNRLIAGASRGVVVIEGAAHSGTLITGDLALEIGRTVFAVPGPLGSALAETPTKLLRDGARAIGTVEHLLEDLGASEGSASLPLATLTAAESAAGHISFRAGLRRS